MIGSICQELPLFLKEPTETPGTLWLDVMKRVIPVIFVDHTARVLDKVLSLVVEFFQLLGHSIVLETHFWQTPKNADLESAEGVESRLKKLKYHLEKLIQSIAFTQFFHQFIKYTVGYLEQHSNLLIAPQQYNYHSLAEKSLNMTVEIPWIAKQDENLIISEEQAITYRGRVHFLSAGNAIRDVKLSPLQEWNAGSFELKAGQRKDQYDRIC